MATLPLELIDNIFLSNPNKIISTYLAFSKTNASYNANSDADSETNTNKKRKLNNASNKDITGDKYTIKYLLNNDTYMKYYQQSSWLKYFIPSQPQNLGSLKKSSLGNTNASRVKRQAAPINLHVVIEPIKLIATYFNQLETYYKKQSHSDVDDDGDMCALITRFETILDSCDFSNKKYEQQLEALNKYYVYAFEIPSFVKLVLILYNCGYFAESNNGNSKSGIHIFLEMVLEGDSAKITDFTQTYKYYSAIYKFIPLFGINLGMGYSFVIGWDAEIDRMIGLTENGSDGNEVMYNAQRAIRYVSEPLARFERLAKFERLERFVKSLLLKAHMAMTVVKIEKTQFLEDYLKMLSIADTSILLDYSRRLDICDMPM